MKISIILAAFVLITQVTTEELEDTTTELNIDTSVQDSIESKRSKIFQEKLQVRNNQSWYKLPKQEQMDIRKKSEQLEQIFNERLENFTNLKVRPYSHGPAVEVKVDVEIRELLDISEVDMEMKLNLVMDISWFDPRLEFSNEAELDFPDGGVWLGDSVKDKIWTPTVSILNEKESVDHSAGFVEDNLNWDFGGWMFWRVNSVTTVACSMSLEDFPMDEQTCSILIGSPNYRDNQMKIKVHADLNPVFSSSVKSVQLLALRVSPLAQEHATSNRTMYSYELLLRRYVGYYVIGTFFPSALVVFISWLTFWMPRGSAGERMALGVTCVLTITTLLISSQASSPKVSYIKAIDIYMGVCFALVFTTLLQSTVVGYLLRKVQVQENGGANQPPREFSSIVRQVMSGRLEAEGKQKVTRVILKCDIGCRVVFPLIFFIFNAVYWTYYLIGTKFNAKKGWMEPSTYAKIFDARQNM